MDPMDPVSLARILQVAGNSIENRRHKEKIYIFLASRSFIFSSTPLKV